MHKRAKPDRPVRRAFVRCAALLAGTLWTGRNPRRYAQAHAIRA